MKRLHAYAVWIAIVALLIDGLLPTAVAAAARPNTAAPLALCSAAAGGSLPGRHAPTLPTRHCALCVAAFVGLLPSRDGGPAPRRLAGAVDALIAATATTETRRVDYAVPQPRAPPHATS